MVSKRMWLISLIVILTFVFTKPGVNYQAAGLQACTSSFTERVSVATDGTQGNGFSGYYPVVSGDGRFVAFDSQATNLVSGDTNGFMDVFMRDRQSGITERVSVASDGTQGNGDSQWVAISGNGRYVAFGSLASNFVISDTNGKSDVLVRDRQTGVIERVSVASNGTQGDGDSDHPAITPDGRYVAFTSAASNLVITDTNGVSDIFVHDRQTGLTERVSVASDGSEGNDNSDRPAISDDGRFVAFNSNASTLVSGDTNEKFDIFVRDLQTHQTERVSVASDGIQGDDDSRWPTISADGRYVAFYSFAYNLIKGETSTEVGVYIHDRQTGKTERVSVSSNGTQANGFSSFPSISADGRYVAFDSYASNLVNGDINSRVDSFVHDRQTRLTERVSVASDGSQGDNESTAAAISADGRYVVFWSSSTNLVSGDTNGIDDIFIHERQPPQSVYLPVVTRN